MSIIDDLYNNRKGNLTGYDCPKCLNRGDFSISTDDYSGFIECDCMRIRRILKIIEKSGLSGVFKQYSFDRYSTEHDWQKVVLNTAKDFVNNEQSSFFIGGQVGCGKTHICTAICNAFMKQGKSVKYIVWNDAVTQLKQNVSENKMLYNSLIEELKNVKILYIDDLFKIEPTKADIDNAFKIINYRYNESKSDTDKKTIISSEKTMTELMTIDEAIASRIKEMCGNFVLNIEKDIEKNYRNQK